MKKTGAERVLEPLEGLIRDLSKDDIAGWKVVPFPPKDDSWQPETIEFPHDKDISDDETICFLKRANFEKTERRSLFFNLPDKLSKTHFSIAYVVMGTDTEFTDTLLNFDYTPLLHVLRKNGKHSVTENIWVNHHRHIGCFIVYLSPAVFCSIFFAKNPIRSKQA